MRQALIVFFLLFTSFNILAQETNKPDLERVVRVGYPTFDWQPFTYISKDKQVIGLLPAIFQEIAKNSGYQIEVLTYPSYAEVNQALRHGEVDIIMGASKTPERVTWLSFSSPIMLVPNAVITHEPNINSLLELKDQHIATEAGFAINEVLLRATASQIELSNYPGSQDAFSAVVKGYVDAYVGNAITLDYLYTHQNVADDLNITLLHDMPFDHLHFAGLYKNQKLIDELNAGLKLISSTTFNKLYEVWLTKSQSRYVYQQHDLNLTDEEICSIRKDRNVKVLYSANNYPFAFTNDKGEMDGMSADILEKMAKKLNLNIEPTPYTGNDIEGALIEGDFDLILSFTCKEQNIPYISCTSAYMHDPWIAVSAINSNTLNLSKTRKLGVLNGHKKLTNIEPHFPAAQEYKFDSTEQLLNAILEKKVEVAVLPLSKANRLITPRYFGQLKVINEPVGDHSRAISFGVNKTQPILLSILNKAHASISEEEMQAINHKWNDVKIDSEFSFSKLPSWLLLVLGGVCSTFLIIAYSNRKLKQEIAQRHSVEKELRLVNSNFGGIVAQLIRYGDDIDDISWSYVSSNIEKYLGLTPEQLYQTPKLLMEFLTQHAEDHRFLNDIQESRFADSLYTTLKLNINGKSSWFQVTGVCTLINKNRHWTFTLVDISQLKQKQAELNEARKLAEAAAEAKSRFLAMMSHEIRTPISGILSLLELMAPHLNSKELYGIHKNLTHSGHNLLNIVNDVLDFSKIEAGKLNLSPRDCQLSSFICELVQPHIAHVERKGLKFKLRLDPQLAYSFKIDDLRLKQVLNNLLNNASKFTSEGEIWLSVDLLSATDEHQTIGFAVTDTGMGISSGDINKLFQPFEQVDLSSERRFSGTGLGLSICQQLVQLMGGKISVDSTRGQGSTFKFNLTFTVVAVEVPTRVNKHCGIIVSDPCSYDLLANYLKNWHCTAFDLSTIENKISLASWASESKVDVLLIENQWCVQQGITISWLKSCLPTTQIILLKHQSMLSPTPTTLGWELSINPLIPQHLLHLITKPEFFEIKFANANTTQSSLLTREQAIAQNKLILVAEDHPINQDVIRMQLAKLGYFADIFEDGQQALAAYQQQKYNLLLTDCHMPELDGYGLVNIIRETERAKQLTHLPVIALTANAISSEKERCQDLGFDDYLIKPVSLSQLQKVLQTYLAETSENPLADIVINESKAHSELTLRNDLDSSLLAIDIEALMTNFGDMTICKSLLNKFIVTAEQDTPQLKQAVDAANFETIALLSHRFKGAAGVIESQRLAGVSKELEAAAIAHNLTLCQQLLSQLTHCMEQIKAQVEQL
ncbi:transporter substrate-binding domain-containing protein [Shewanella fidelis]|uniref:histidine kinase n=1 Tax=Shewanella fidelis TaxID=173509 RepID=A0AAW8NQP7_9GAMM|nr:transporter substrate-binding domain-containing protein [Shewanella fidelis]MDR8524916.1 transporter substrate-binding domain-containing protein [Shewanella fidelis]MDW4810987.1 transporter substrate-binding domain-containing protein [Shewanella fidelis]MDW4815234.1 transporter substrate-binding domain-containing protein [Shewanella fidelis]MDW4819324.1 transporter substrate-binding domain-containing protein [Shewanella fidelis]MDW4822998.1 transporter substrate-binding domain-containing pr